MNSSINSREPFFMSLILRILILLKKKLYCFSPIEQIECDGKKKKIQTSNTMACDPKWFYSCHTHQLYACGLVI